MTGSNTSTAAASSSEIPPFTKRQQLEQKLSFITAHYSSDVHLITQKILTDLNQQRKAGTPLPSCLTIWLLKAEGPYPNLLCQLFHITCMCMVTKQSGFLLPPFWKGSFIYLTCMNHKGKPFHHKMLKTWDFIPVTAAFFYQVLSAAPFSANCSLTILLQTPPPLPALHKAWHAAQGQLWEACWWPATFRQNTVGLSSFTKVFVRPRNVRSIIKATGTPGKQQLHGIIRGCKHNHRDSSTYQQSSNPQQGQQCKLCSILCGTEGCSEAPRCLDTSETLPVCMA